MSHKSLPLLIAFAFSACAALAQSEKPEIRQEIAPVDSPAVPVVRPLSSNAVELATQLYGGRFVWQYQLGMDTMVLGGATALPEDNIVFFCRYHSTLSKTPRGGYNCVATVNLRRPSRLRITFPGNRSEVDLVIADKAARLYGSASFTNTGWSGPVDFLRTKD